MACSKTHPCGHPCGGVKNEELCLPCLHGCDKSTSCLKQDADDMCMICFTEALSAAPAVQVTLESPFSECSSSPAFVKLWHVEMVHGACCMLHLIMNVNITFVE